MNTTICDDNKNITQETEESGNQNSNEKRIDVPEWNDGLHKIIVGYH